MLEPVPVSRAFLLVMALGAVAAGLTLGWTSPGVGWPLTGIAIGLAVFTGRRKAVGSLDPVDLAHRSGVRWGLASRSGFALATLALLGVGAVRDAGWLFALC